MKTMNSTLKNIVAWLSFLAAAQATAADLPVKIQLPLQGKTFKPYTMEFSADGARVCIAGKDADEMGSSSPRLVLVDRSRQAVAWKKAVTLPDGYPTAYPVQCLAGTDRVYLLINAETSLSPPDAKSSAYLYAFDLAGKQLASTRLGVPGQSQYAYTMSASPDGVKIAGYTRDVDDKNEHYATFTLTLDPRLETSGAPVIRKNGAYTSPFAARMVGDSVYVAGRFFPATVEKDSVGDFAASRLKIAGGYVWSSRLEPVKGYAVRLAVAEDGTSYTLGFGDEGTTLTTVTPDGKARPPLSYTSAYCVPQGLARAGAHIIAVRQACKGKDKVLVSIDAASGRESVVKPVPDEPIYVAAQGTLWGMLARDKKGQVVLYSATGGL